MRYWNSWGTDTTEKPTITEGARQFVRENLGEGRILPQATLDEVCAKVPASRLPDHELICKDVEHRVRHARGQSLPDWVAMKSGVFEHFPDGVAYPETPEQIRELMDLAREKDFVIIPYGGGTSVAGHINPPALDKPVLTLSLEHMNRLVSLDTESQIATFGPGTPGPMVEAQLARSGYTLGHFPQSFELSTIGGWVASRSSGQQSLRYGRIEQLFAGGRLETFEGTLGIPTMPASSAGPDIREMVLGSEGRMGVLSEVKVRVSPAPEKEKFFVVYFPNWRDGFNCTKAAVQSRIPLSMLRLSNAIETFTQLKLAGHEDLIAMLKKYLRFRNVDEGKCMLTFGITGTRAQYRAAHRQIRRLVRHYNGVGMTIGDRIGRIWEKGRFRFPYLRENLWQEGYAVDTLETSVDWSRVDNTLNAMEDALRGALADQGENVHVFTHLSHFYAQGSSIYTTYLFRCGETYEETLANWRKLKCAASQTVVAHGGTISHQHGVGRDHAPYLSAEKGELGMAAISTLCQRFDPEGRLNPGALLEA